MSILKEKDFKILHFLMKNSRIGIKELSKLVGYSNETISSKIKQFEEMGLIRAFSIQLDLNELGFQEYVCMVKVRSISTNRKRQFIEFLEKSDYTSWIGEGFGSYDLKISIYVRDYNDVLTFQEVLYKYYNDVISSIQFDQVIKKFKNSHYYIDPYLNFSKKNINEIELLDKKLVKNFKPSKIQLEILYLLSQNSRISLSSLAQSTNTTIENCSYHISLLKKNNVIKKFSTVVDGKYLNKNWVLLMLKINPNSFDNLKTFFLKSKHMTSLFNVIGSRNVHITLVHDQIQDFYSMLNDLRELFQQDIMETDFFFIYDFYKYPQLPKVIYTLLD